MKRLLKLGIFSVVPFLILAPTLTQAFNSAAHVYIAEQVFPDCGRKINLHYGSVTPDLAIFVTKPLKWPTAYYDTHNTALLPWAWSSTQRAFAKGWLTHQVADYYADLYIDKKITEPFDECDTFLEYIATFLDGDSDGAEKLAHHAIEKAMDLLLIEDYPELKLAEKLRKAVLLRSWQDRFLLVKVFVWKEGKTDWFTLATTELAFRNWTCLYSLALDSCNPKEVIVQLGVLLAKEIYGVDILADDLRVILDAAIILCDDYYENAIGPAIDAFEK